MCLVVCCSPTTSWQVDLYALVAHVVNPSNPQIVWLTRWLDYLISENHHSVLLFEGMEIHIVVKSSRQFEWVEDHWNHASNIISISSFVAWWLNHPEIISKSSIFIYFLPVNIVVGQYFPPNVAIKPCNTQQARKPPNHLVDVLRDLTLQEHGTGTPNLPA